MARVALMRGQFNPVTRQHTDYAAQLLKSKQYREVWFVLDEETEGLKQKYDLLKMMTHSRRHFAVKIFSDNKKLYSENDEFIEMAEDEKMLEASEKVRNGDFSLIPKQARTYIMKNSLYIETIAASRLDAKRYDHVLSVARMAVEMAARNGCNYEKAYVAGLMHDCAKQMDKQDMRKYMEAYYPQHIDLNEHTWHQYVGEVLLKNYYGVTDKEILKAVKHHCLGDDNALLSKIVYCCDKLDPLRGYDSSREIKLCMKDINKGFEAVMNTQLEYLRKEGVIE